MTVLALVMADTRHNRPIGSLALTKVPMWPSMVYVLQVAQVVAAHEAQLLPPRD